MSERMTDAEFALHERVKARRPGRLLTEAKRARGEAAELRAKVKLMESALRHAMERNHAHSPRGCDGCGEADEVLAWRVGDAK